LVATFTKRPDVEGRGPDVAAAMKDGSTPVFTGMALVNRDRRDAAFAGSGSDESPGFACELQLPGERSRPAAIVAKFIVLARDRICSASARSTPK
jgi:hypothetical protein